MIKIKEICKGGASCEKYVEGVLENITPKLKIGYGCTCKKALIERRN